MPEVKPGPEPAAGWEADWDNVYANVRDDWFAYFNPPQKGAYIVESHTYIVPFTPEYRQILRRYLWAVNDIWVKRGELRFIVIDEDGKPIEDGDITREVWDFVKLGSDLEPRFRVTTQKVIGEQRIKLTSKMYNGLEVVLKTMGRRWTRFRLPLGGPIEEGFYERGRMTDAHDLLQRGTVLPPLTPDGPVRIVMPFRYKWENAIISGKEDSVGSISYNDREAQKILPLDSPVVVSTDHPGAAPAPKRGMYAFIDRNGKSYTTYAFDAGKMLSVDQAGDPGAARGIFWYFMYGGSGGTAPLGNEPYRWVLLYEPTRIPPEEVREGYEKALRKIPDYVPPSTAPAKQP